jgi:hypothetical protein
VEEQQDDETARDQGKELYQVVEQEGPCMLEWVLG